MKRTRMYIVAVVLALACLIGWRQLSQSTSPSLSSAKTTVPEHVQLNQVYGSLPLSFEANRGQAEKNVRFLSRGNGYTLFLTPAETVLTLRQPSGRTSNDAVLRMRLVGANPSPISSEPKNYPPGVLTLSVMILAAGAMLSPITPAFAITRYFLV